MTPNLFVAAFSGVASALVLILFEPGGGDPMVSSPHRPR